MHQRNVARLPRHLWRCVARSRTRRNVDRRRIHASRIRGRNVREAPSLSSPYTLPILHTFLAPSSARSLGAPFLCTMPQDGHRRQVRNRRTLTEELNNLDQPTPSPTTAATLPILTSSTRIAGCRTASASTGNSRTPREPSSPFR